MLCQLNFHDNAGQKIGVACSFYFQAHLLGTEQNNSSSYKPPGYEPPLVFLVFLILSNLTEPCTTLNPKLGKFAGQ